MVQIIYRWDRLVSTSWRFNGIFWSFPTSLQSPTAGWSIFQWTMQPMDDGFHQVVPQFVRSRSVGGLHVRPISRVLVFLGDISMVHGMIMHSCSTGRAAARGHRYISGNPPDATKLFIAIQWWTEGAKELWVSEFPIYPYIFPIQWGAKELLRISQPIERWSYVGSLIHFFFTNRTS